MRKGQSMEFTAAATRSFEARKEHRNGEAVTTFPPRKETLMARIDAKVKEPLTLSKGTLALFAAAMVLLQVVFNYGGSMIGWARDDQSQKEKLVMMQNQLDETRKSVDTLSGKVDGLRSDMATQAIADAKAQGYKLGLADAHGK